MVVEIFSVEKCEPCEELKGLLNEKGKKYKEYDISKNEKAREEVKRRKPEAVLNGNAVSVPVWCIENACHIGYSEEEAREVLNL